MIAQHPGGGLVQAILSLADASLQAPPSWLGTVLWAVAWLILMLLYSPVADWLATQLVAKPPTLGVFRALQQSWIKLVAGIVIAWILGGFLEELVLRGVILRGLAPWLSLSFAPLIAIGLAVCFAAIVAGLLHFYQGLRAMLIVTQLSVLFGVLFVISGYNLWAAALCHGLYDTVAFIRFAQRSSRYSIFDDA
jgi:membrane protease YdiL (CAAX protease family)